VVRSVARTGLCLKASRCRPMCQHCHSKAAVPFADQLLDLVAFHEPPALLVTFVRIL